VEVEAFIAADSIGPEYYEKPYVLVPGKKAAKGYVLFREVLKRTGKIGIARVVIRTREYLSAVIPKGDALVLILLRYPQELVSTDEYAIPEGGTDAYRISDKELDMAEQLISSMAGEWKPEDYHDEFRSRLQKVIEKRMQADGAVVTAPDAEALEDTSTNVVDFMALLQKSLESKRRTPAAQDVPVRPAKSAAKKTAVTKSAAAKKAPGKAASKAATKSVKKDGKTATKSAANKRVRKSG